jgi:hypothetical protein
MTGRISALVLLLLAAIGCGDPTAPPTPATLAGTWMLHTVNGNALPYRISFRSSASDPPSTLEVQSGVMVISINGTWTERITSRVVQGTRDSTSVSADSGTYRVHRDSISFDKYQPPVSDFDHRDATTHGDKMLLPTFPFFFVYKKQ